MELLGDMFPNQWVNGGIAGVNLIAALIGGPLFYFNLMFLIVYATIFMVRTPVAGRIISPPEPPKELTYEQRWDNPEFVAQIHKTRSMEQEIYGVVKTFCDCSPCQRERERATQVIPDAPKIDYNLVSGVYSISRNDYMAMLEYKMKHAESAMISLPRKMEPDNHLPPRAGEQYKNIITRMYVNGSINGDTYVRLISKSYEADKKRVNKSCDSCGMYASGSLCEACNYHKARLNYGYR